MHGRIRILSRIPSKLTLRIKNILILVHVGVAGLYCHQLIFVKQG